MNRDDAFAAILSRFPFEAISERMHHKPRWYWGAQSERHIPQPRDIKQLAIRLWGHCEGQPNASLRSGGLSLVVTPESIYMWFGQSKNAKWAEDTEQITEHP